MFSIPQTIHIRTDLDFNKCNEVFKRHQKVEEKKVPYFLVSVWDERGNSWVAFVKKVYGPNNEKDEKFSVKFRWEGYGLNGPGLVVEGCSTFGIWFGFITISLALWTVLSIMYLDQPWRSIFFWVFVASFNLFLLIRILYRISKLPSDFNACVLFLQKLVDPLGKFKDIKPAPVNKIIS